MTQCNNYGGGNCGSTPTTTVTSVGIGRAVSSDPNGLPFTGGDAIGGLMLGIGAIVGGIALMRSNRRKSAV